MIKTYSDKIAMESPIIAYILSLEGGYVEYRQYNFVKCGLSFV